MAKPNTAYELISKDDSVTVQWNGNPVDGMGEIRVSGSGNVNFGNIRAHLCIAPYSQIECSVLRVDGEATVSSGTLEVGYVAKKLLASGRAFVRANTVGETSALNSAIVWATTVRGDLTASGTSKVHAGVVEGNVRAAEFAKVEVGACSNVAVTFQDGQLSAGVCDGAVMGGSGSQPIRVGVEFLSNSTLELMQSPLIQETKNSRNKTKGLK